MKDITWFDPSGDEMTDEAWNAGFVRCIGVCFAGESLEEFDQFGEPILGDTLLMLLNAHEETIPFCLPAHGTDRCWELLFDTALRGTEDDRFASGHSYALPGRAMAAFRIKKSMESEA